MESTHISERYRSWFPESSFDAIARRFPVNLAEHRKRTVVSQTTLTDTAGEILDVYFKAYASRANAIDGCARKSRAVCEARNLGRFHAWGIRSAEVVACGYRRRLMGLCADQSFIITRAIPQGQPLQDWWTGLETPLSQELRRKLITELGMQTRALHAQGFYHQDLKWRNVLVDREHQLWWIDCPSGHYGRFPWRHVHGRVKDLATLDSRAKLRCTAEERRLFLRIYLDTEDSATIDRWARMVVRYGQRRFA